MICPRHRIRWAAALTQARGRGRYWPPGSARGPGDEAALHLWVSPGASLAKESVEAQRGAVAAAIAMLREHAAAASAPRGRAPPVAPYVPAPVAAMMPSYPAVPPPHGEVSTKLPLGFDCSSDPGFDAAARLRGPGGAYLAHVARQSGAAVELVGAGAGGAGESAEPLALLVRAPHAAALATACALAGSLLATVSADWSRAHPDAPPPPPMPMPAPMMPPGGVGYAPVPYAAAVGHLAPGPPPYGMPAAVPAYAPPPGGYAPYAAPPYAAPPYGYAPVPPPGPPPLPRASYASVAPPPSVMAGAHVVMAGAEEAAPQQQQQAQVQQPLSGAAPAPRRFREFKEAPPPVPAETAPPPPSLAALAGYGEHQDQH
jgi:hypothetical protein